ncbi:MAG: HAD-IA family hydrolase [Akkermansiaceae bacterium]|nr:HAD-IA family hydrolase [Verrucomicrobiales bacterium]
MTLRSDSTLRAVSFDVGGTLIEPWPSVGHVYAEIAAQHGAPGLSPQLLNERFKTAWRSCKDFDYTRVGWENLVQQTFAGLIPSAVSFFPELYERFTEPEAWQVFDDVRPTLDKLAEEEIRLVVISNWDDRLRPLLKRLKLDQYFESLIVSCEVGFAKPSPIIFEQAASRLGLAPGDILHVGDSAEMDLRGARAAGFQAIQLKRGEEAKSPDVITSLAELRISGY